MLTRIFVFVLFIVAAVTVAKLYAEDVVRVDNNDMAPTIVRGDYVLVNRLYTSITRGDVVFFRHPDKPESMMFRRVLAVPGDEIAVVRDGIVMVNAQAASRQAAGEIVLQSPERAGGLPIPYELEVETWIGGRSGRIVRRKNGKVTPSEPRPLSAAYFVLGDNRTDATDSRAFGPVRPGFIRGRAWWILDAGADASPSLDPKQRSWRPLE